MPPAQVQLPQSETTALKLVADDQEMLALRWQLYAMKGPLLGERQVRQC